jgi:hypothetical protein
LTATFSITQTPVSKNLYLYPDGDYHSGCSAVGAGNNYQCVDDAYDIPDEDTSYVWMINPSTVTDMYTLQNHTSETGAINYVRIYARCKSNLYPQSASGLYRILANHSSATSRSIDINMTTDYNTYNYLLTSTPSGAAWNWTAIDNLKIGFDASSPNYIGTFYLTIRPDAIGTYNDSTPIPVVSRYLNVDETITDEDTTYNRFSGGYPDYSSRATDTFHSSVVTTGLGGTINNVSVFVRARQYDIYPVVAHAVVLLTGTVNSYALSYANTIYTLWSHAFTTRPGGGAWTWTNINAFEFGYGYGAINGAADMYVTQCYAIVNYTDTVKPMIHTTQMYAMVNYNPSSTTCYLNRPIKYGISNTRKVSIIQPERGDRVVYDLCRESKVLSMDGLECDSTSTATSRLLCVRNMKDNGEYITLSGFGDDKVDTTWLITDFSYNQDEMNPQMWRWSLIAEKKEVG